MKLPELRLLAFSRAAGTPLLCLALLVPGCGKREDRAAPIKVGAVLFLTGPAASYGETQKNAFEIAKDEIARGGGIKGRPLEIVYEDSAHDTAKAVAAVKKLATVDGVAMIVEVTGSDEALAVAPFISEEKIPVLSAVDSSPKLSGVSPYFFRVVPSDLYQGRFLAEWARDMAWKSAAILYVDNEWGIGLSAAVKDTFVSAGGTIAALVSSPDGASDFASQLAKIDEAKPDGVFLLLYPQDAGRALKQTHDLGLKLGFLGGDPLSGEEVATIAGEAVSGLMYCLPTRGKGPAFDAFVKTYKEKYGSEPNANGVKSYDALMIAADALRAEGTDREGIRGFLAELKAYQGASGNITLDKQGDLESQRYDRFVYRDGVAKKMD